MAQKTLKGFMQGDLDDVFFDTDEFAVTATASGASFKGIFTAETEVLNPVSGDVETVADTLLISDTDAAGLSRGDVVTINGADYRVMGFIANDDGTTLLTLTKETTI